MNKTIYIVILIFTIISCKKNDDTDPVSNSPVNSSGSFSAKVNGVTYTADSARGYILIDTTWGLPMRVFFIMGYCHDRIVSPGFVDTINTTTVTTMNYDSIEAGADIDYNLLSDTVNDNMYIRASFAITSTDTALKKVSGNFSGVMVGDVSGDTIVVTDGVFSNIVYGEL